MMRYIRLIIIFFTYSICYSQDNMCVDNVTSEPLNSIGKYSNGILVEYEKNDDSSIYVTFTNNTDEIYYLFSSYFDEEYSKSKYLNRLNKKDKTIKKSFLPLIPYLSPESNDRYLSGENKLVSVAQINYRFIKINPKTTFKLFIDYSQNDFEKYILDFDVKNSFLASKIKWKKKRNKKCYLNFRKLLEFAVYKEINYLCDLNFYGNKPKEYDDKSKDFEIVSLEVE